jgi:hypothetical protein
MTLTPTAQHEAALAVMAVLANVPMFDVTIEPGEVDGVMTGGHLQFAEGEIDTGHRVLSCGGWPHH